MSNSDGQGDPATPKTKLQGKGWARLMSGQEWYDRFLAEVAGQMFPYRTDREMELVHQVASFFSGAAKRASGVEKLSAGATAESPTPKTSSTSTSLGGI